MKPEQLTRWREEIGYSRTDLARLLGVHRRTVVAWEHGRQSAPPYLRLALSELRYRWYATNQSWRLPPR